SEACRVYTCASLPRYAGDEFSQVLGTLASRKTRCVFQTASDDAARRIPGRLVRRSLSLMAQSIVTRF
ncbi:MAG: hypothetical protein QW587_06550, partial [Candidatus Bathyarchaeia archaeon]